MGSTFAGLEIAKRGLYAQQSALNTTGHNIANANTEGYTRQRVNMEATSPFPYPSLTNDRQAGQVGTGVLVSSIERLRERFLDLQYRGNNNNVGEYGAQADALGKVESIIGEPSDKGLKSTMNEFWNSWQKLTQRPNDVPTRETVLQSGKTLAQTINFIATDLNNLQNNINQEVKDKTDEINTITSQIAALNQQINDIVPHGYQPNDLYDKRDLLIDQLSKMIDINVDTTQVSVGGKQVDGAVNITIKNTDDGSGNPISLVNGTTNSPMTTSANARTLADGTERSDIYVGGVKIDFLGSNISGELHGLIYSRDVSVQNYINRLDGLANSLITQVNSLSDPSKPFFNPLTPQAGTAAGGAAGAIEVVITANDIKAGDPAVAGDNTNAQAMYNLKTTTQAIQWDHVSDDGTWPGSPETTNATFDGFTGQMVSALGIESQKAQRLLDNSQILLSDVENNRQSISGVSLDEEMSNMIKFQHAYNAAARTITTMDEMLDKIINSMGLVGR
jgi:flagellar hook-associated protein 1 FlgK